MATNTPERGPRRTGAVMLLALLFILLILFKSETTTLDLSQFRPSSFVTTSVTPKIKNHTLSSPQANVSKSASAEEETVIPEEEDFSGPFEPDVIPFPVHLPVPETNASQEPVFMAACCGLGHRLSENIPTILYGLLYLHKPILAWWPDVSWHYLFHDSPYIFAGNRSHPSVGRNQRPFVKKPPDLVDQIRANNLSRIKSTGSTLDRYNGNNKLSILFGIPEAQSVAILLRNSLTPTVRHFLDPIRKQVRVLQQKQSQSTSTRHLHFCSHVRTGNNETGDWAHKTWRHLDNLHGVLNGTLNAMQQYHGTLQTSDQVHATVSVFIASDKTEVGKWFEDNIPSEWKMIYNTNALPKPEAGVWFGEHGSKTSKNLTLSAKVDNMAEALSDVMALGECDALFIPNYSSFTGPSILLTLARGKPIFFRKERSYDYIQWDPTNKS